MKRTGFTIIEVVIVFLLMLGVAFLVLPKSLDNTRQAKLISKWTETYSELEYMFSVIKAQSDYDIDVKIKNAENNEVRKQIVLDTIKPYLRITAEAAPNYRQYYMSKMLVPEGGKYFFTNFYVTRSNEVIGLKWINSKCKEREVCALLSFDINGEDLPNTWGYDVFGINIFKDKIGPIGEGYIPDVLKSDCSKNGSGLYCSYYYLMGGKFD